MDIAHPSQVDFWWCYLRHLPVEDRHDLEVVEHHVPDAAVAPGERLPTEVSWEIVSEPSKALCQQRRRGTTHRRVVEVLPMVQALFEGRGARCKVLQKHEIVR